ncbi:cell wall-binding repeat-containing protein [Intrasporangium sp. DVR]|uniref:cell wall-binding repeat-containing protein n=1 Tax=Intrasporangium sp. DVR TaxID=3127867 RepID=UPI00313A6FFB
MTPSTKRTTRAASVTAAALLLPAMAAFGSPAAAHPQGAEPGVTVAATPTDSPPSAPPRTTHSSHPLVDAQTVPGVAALDSADAAEAREHANGKAVEVVSASTPVDLPELAVVGVTWRAGSAPGATVQYRTLDGSTWTDWKALEVEGDHAPEDKEAKQAAAKLGGTRAGSAPLVTTESAEIQVRVIAVDGASPVDAQLAVIDPGTSTAPTSSASLEGSATTGSAETAAAGSQPTILTRAQWGADESIRDPSEPEYGAVDLAVVHHTAGSNLYTESDVPGIIRGIYTYHVKSNGWRDIGYNFLVDRFGRIWEGRYGGTDKAVIGAHAYGVNSWSMGASVLGNFETDTPPPAVGTALRDLVAWKADLHRFDVLGTTTIGGVTYDNLAGHRNINQTECPGANLHATLPTLRTATAALSPTATRYSGENRYETAANASAASFAPGAPVAYVATGASFPDALAGGPAGGHRGGPVLLTAKSSLPTATQAELQRLQPAEVVILGGTAAVSSTVEEQLATVAPKVTRISGEDRYSTAAAVSARTFDTNVPVAYVATGANFPDALAGGPAGGSRGGPLLLTAADALPPASIDELARLKPASIVVLGGTNAISQEVVSQLGSYSTSVVRVSGADRYETAAWTSARTFSAGVPVAYVATGSNFPDALSGGPLGGHLGGPVLLTRRDGLPSVTANELVRLAPQRVVVLGGTSAVSTSVAQRLYNYEVSTP